MSDDHPDLKRCVIRILNSKDHQVAGTGFFVAENLAVTCAHVIDEAGSGPGEQVTVEFSLDWCGKLQTIQASVLREGWRPRTADRQMDLATVQELDDVAFLQLPMPQVASEVWLGSVKEKNIGGHGYNVFGFSDTSDFRKGIGLSGLLQDVDLIKESSGTSRRPLFHFKGEISPGMSGSPVLDLDAKRVIGMVSERLPGHSWGITSDTLAELNSQVHLWSDEYGPQELDKYLEYIIKMTQYLDIPGENKENRKLEKLYVSLKTQNIDVHERQAEHERHNEYISNFADEQEGHFQAIQNQRTLYAIEDSSREQERLFGVREPRIRNFAHVIQEHQQVVLLGDPGSGKSTLCKWIALKSAMAMISHCHEVLAYPNEMPPDNKGFSPISLGPPRLPIFIRVADYANWDDHSLSLANYINRGLFSEIQSTTLGNGLPIVQARSVAHDYLLKGRAIIILDGLDEVSDKEKRQKIMESIVDLMKEVKNNVIILTSRITGYQAQFLNMEISHYELIEMSDAAIKGFCISWMKHAFRNREENVAKEEAKQFIHEIFSHYSPQIQEIARSPFLLTLLAQLYCGERKGRRGESAKTVLPGTRTELFQKIIEHMFNLRKSEWNEANINRFKFEQVFRNIAIYLYEKLNGSDRIDPFKLKEALMETFKDPNDKELQVRTMQRVIEKGNSLFVAKGRGNYGFLHRSFQEYFAASYLTDTYLYKMEQVRENLANKAKTLDSLWYEPVLLGIGLVSLKENSHRDLCAIVDALLDTKDDLGVSELIPLREMLAAAAWGECARNRFPSDEEAQKNAHRISEKLLEFYAMFAQQTSYSDLNRHELRTRILRAFKRLYFSPVSQGAERALCEALKHSDNMRRFVAVDIIIETSWDTKDIARTLVETWSNFDGPAASLLTAINQISGEHPGWFRDIALPMRDALKKGGTLFKRIREKKGWHVLIPALYCPADAVFDPKRLLDQINRDSPLTLLLLDVLNDKRSFADLRKDLRELAMKPGTAEARDAALALSAIGDKPDIITGNTDVVTPQKLWIYTAIEHSGERSIRLRSIFSSLEYMAHNNFARHFDVSNDLPTELEYVEKVTNDIANQHRQNRRQDFTEALNLAYRLSSPEITTPEQALEDATKLANILKVDRLIASDHTETSARCCERDLMRDQEIDLDQEILECIKSAIKRWKGGNQELVKQLEISQQHIDEIQKSTQSSLPLPRVQHKIVEILQDRWSSRLPTSSDAATTIGQLTEETLQAAIDNLTQTNDIRRNAARNLLDSSRNASSMGRSTVERLINIAEEHVCYPPLSRQKSTNFKSELSHTANGCAS